MLPLLVTSTTWIWLKWNNTLISTSILTGLQCRNKPKRRHLITLLKQFQLLRDLPNHIQDVMMIMKMSLITTKLILLRENPDLCNNSMLITIILLIQMVVTSKQKQVSLVKLVKLLMQKKNMIHYNFQKKMMSSMQL